MFLVICSRIVKNAIPSQRDILHQQIKNDWSVLIVAFVGSVKSSRKNDWHCIGIHCTYKFAVYFANGFHWIEYPGYGGFLLFYSSVDSPATEYGGPLARSRIPPATQAMLNAACCARLATLLRHVVCCWLKFERSQIFHATFVRGCCMML